MTPLHEQPSSTIEDLKRAAEKGDWERVIGALDVLWAELLRDEPAALAEIVRHIPAEVQERNPRWAMAIGYLDRLESPTDARTLRVNTPVTLTDGSSLLDRLANLTSRGASRRAAGDFEAATALATQGRELVVEAGEAAVESLSLALSEFHYQWGMNRELAGDLDGSVTDYTASYEYARATGHVVIEHASAGALAWAHGLAGRRAAAEGWLGRLPNDDGDEWWLSRYASSARHAQALLFTDELRLADAASVIDGLDILSSPERWAAHVYVESRLASHRKNGWGQLSDLDAIVSSQPPEVSGRGANAALTMLARSSCFAAVNQYKSARDVLQPIAVGGVFRELVAVATITTDLLRGDRAASDAGATALLASGATNPRTVSASLMLAACTATAPAIAEQLAGEAVRLAIENALYYGLARAPGELVATALSRASQQLDPDMRRRVLATAPSRPRELQFELLTPRERAVVTEILTPSTVTEIAARLFVSPNTVKAQLRNIYKKLGVTSRAELQREARQHGF